MEEKNTYDLRTFKTLQNAVELAKKYGWIIAPLPWLIYKTLSPEVSTEKQIKMALNLIKAGKENGAKRIRLKLGHDAGIKLESILKGFPLSIVFGNQADMEIENDFDNLSTANIAYLNNIK